MLPVEFWAKPRHGMKQIARKPLACARGIIDMGAQCCVLVVDLAGAVRHPLARMRSIARPVRYFLRCERNNDFFEAQSANARSLSGRVFTTTEEALVRKCSDQDLMMPTFYR